MKETKETGITLIALVITVIIMLILAGVAINLTVGDNGIFKKSQEGAQIYKNAASNEMTALTKLEEEMDNIKNNKITYNDAMKSLKAGDFVKYDTGVEGVGEITCKVLYEASSEYGLQIIPVDCIKNTNLKNETNTEGYVTIQIGQYHDWDISTRDYNNAIVTLNTEAGKYNNGEYSIDARCVGSNPKDKNLETNTYAVFEEIRLAGKEGDNNYEKDYDTLETLGILETKCPIYWMASRYTEPTYVYSGESGIAFYVRCVANDSSYINEYIIRDKNGHGSEVGGGTYNTGEETCGIRPVFSLKGDLKLTEGDGKSEATAYKLGK